MSNEKACNLDDVYILIGRAVSFLLLSGKPVRMNDITALLKQHEEQASERKKHNYAKAIRLIADKMN